MIRRDYSQQGSERSPLRFLIKGKAGTGKTKSLETLLQFGRVMHIDLDNQAPLYDDSLPKDKFVSVSVGPPGVRKEAMAELSAWLRGDLLKEAQEKPFAAIVLDSLTSLNLHGYTDILAKRSKLGGVLEGWNEWELLKASVRNTILTMCAIPVTHAHIVIGHTDYEKDEETGRMIQELSVTGKLSNQLLRFFTEIYESQVLIDNQGRRTFQWVTLPTNYITARTSLKINGEITQDYGIPLNAYFGKDGDANK